MKLASITLASAIVLAACAAAPDLGQTATRSSLDATASTGTDDNRLIAGAGVAIATTAAGNLQGFIDAGVYTFRGVPYGQAKRFMPPEPAARWEGVKTALSYGSICPQPIGETVRDPQTFFTDNRFWPQSEACQNLNVWTPALDDGKKRPVMVWLHGGGFFSGSSIESTTYDGRELSKKGDVVVVSVNHRLNILGFLDLSAYGEEYKHSGNVGMLDTLEALRWVRANIANFGGDPDNVTIFGQSGGGGKVATLMAAPSATGLFDKAVIQSGLSGVTGSPEQGSQATARLVAERTIAQAGLESGDVAGLAALSYEALEQAGGRALREVSAQLNPGSGGPMGFPSVNWGPVVDHDFLPEIPFGSSAPAASKGVPLLVGSTLNEFQLIGIEDWKTWSPEKTREQLTRRLGANLPAVEAAFQKAYPDMPQSEWLTVDSRSRAGALRAAEYKAAQGDDAFVYLFSWKAPVLDGHWAAGHSMELAFVFNNVERGRQSTGGGEEVSRLSDEVSQAWINFARNGNPTTASLPGWPAYSSDKQGTMVFDSASKVMFGHDRALVETLGGGAIH